MNSSLFIKAKTGTNSATGFDMNKSQGIRAITFISKSNPASQLTPTAVQLGKGE
ncbi:hypothetical protein [Salmonella bongori]|uniref:hypothetical protein n=1 Tax=Salmonella bongori TaxID=54736 RepID=UPI0003222D02